LPGLTVSALARVEVPAALWRKHRAGELTAETASALAGRFASDYAGDRASRARFAIISAGTAVLDAAAELVASAGLRAHDGVQLAAAIAARAADDEIDAFACFDLDLRRAAAMHGFALLPATM
jgi:predicted nucleic acid-binding protein